MPVRFQVDADFYDHPKTIDASDAAVALWTRAGSYSAAKLTDGFVPEAMLVRLSQTAQAAAQELVRRGLWKRVRGGYRFHDWEERGNLTRERVEADRSADRQRKRAKRAGHERSSSTHRGPNEGTSSGHQKNDEHDHETGTQNTNGQVNTGNVRPDSTPESDRTPEGFQSLSVSVSESVSKERPRKRGTRLPPDFTVTPDMVTWAREKCPHVDGKRETEKFTNHWQGESGARATKVDWVAAWRTWMLKAEDWATPTRPNGKPRIDPANSWKADLS